MTLTYRVLKDRHDLNDKDLLVTLTVKQLDDLIYFTTVRACKKVEEIAFKGYLPFLTLVNSQLEELQRDVDYIKNYQKQGGKR